MLANIHQQGEQIILLDLTLTLKLQSLEIGKHNRPSVMELSNLISDVTSGRDEAADCLQGSTKCRTECSLSGVSNQYLGGCIKQ